MDLKTAIKNFPSIRRQMKIKLMETIQLENSDYAADAAEITPFRLSSDGIIEMITSFDTAMMKSTILQNGMNSEALVDSGWVLEDYSEINSSNIDEIIDKLENYTYDRNDMDRDRDLREYWLDLLSAAKTIYIIEIEARKMKDISTKKYRVVGNSLYEYDESSNSYIHVYKDDRYTGKKLIRVYEERYA